MIIALLFWAVLLTGLVWATQNRRQTKQSDDYSKGYWDGYRALGAKVQAQLDADELDRGALQRFVDEGVEDVPAAMLAEVADPVGLLEEVQVVPAPDTATRNLNLLLYMASFLLVAAGVTLVSSTLPSAAKVAGVWALIMIFYGGGLWIHAYMVRLKSAALAFVGTGLALVPFGGVALELYGGVSGDIAWLLTSLIGIVMTAYVAVRLQALVVSYLTLGFVLSLATSVVATASEAVVGYFVVLIGVSLCASLISYLKPHWVPPIFAEPIERTGQIVTPVALGASLVMGSQLSLREHEIVVAATAAHYMVAWLQTRRQAYEHVVRALVHVECLLVAWELTEGQHEPFGLVFLALTTFQLLYSLVRLRDWTRADAESMRWPIVMMGLQVIGISWWFGSDSMAALTSISLSVLGLTSVTAGYVWRRVGLLAPALVASLVLPWLIGRGVLEPQVDWIIVSATSLVGAAGVLYVYWLQGRRFSLPVRHFLQVSSASHLLLASLFAFFADATAGGVVLLLIAAVWGLGSYLYRRPCMVAFVCLAYAASLMSFWELSDGAETLTWIGVGLLASASYYGLSWLLTRDRRRRSVLVVATWITLGITTCIASTDGELLRGAAGILLAGAATVVLEGVWRRRDDMVEIGFYIGTAGLQWLVALQWPYLEGLVYVHWWACALAGVAIWRKQYLPRLAVAMGLLTFFGALYALSRGGGYSLLFMVEHVVLLVVGVVTGRSWVIWWGVIAASLAVLYALRDVAWLAFGFLGLLLIGFVVWRLQRASQ